MHLFQSVYQHGFCSFYPEKVIYNDKTVEDVSLVIRKPSKVAKLDIWCFFHPGANSLNEKKSHAIM